MKLELKHLAGFLPYGLKYKCNGIIYYYQHCSTRDFDYENSKPILRPLSDLTKEIEVNGEKFVPIEQLDNVRVGVEIYQPINVNMPLELNVETENYSQTIDLMDGYFVVQKLIEWHFDIYGLIENNLAIDINTL